MVKPEEGEVTWCRLLWLHAEYTSHAPVTSIYVCTDQEQDVKFVWPKIVPVS